MHQRSSSLVSSASLVFAGAFVLAGCGETPVPQEPAPDLSNAVYDEAHMLEVAIEMAPADWETLRHEAPPLEHFLNANCQDAPPTNNYVYMSATVTVDGHTLSNVGVRKKGNLGSASLSKPSLKVDFGEFVQGQEYSGVEKLTLNNSVQDASFTKQCLAYKAFGDAGIASPRCNLAHVTVNGNDLGIYVNVEGVGRRMLRRFFQDDTGNLYEGQASDFRPGWMATYEKKTNESDPDRSDLDAVTNALMANDAELESKLGGVVDIEHFMHYWATEALVAAWDSYSTDGNNHLVYHDPTSGKMFFIPWGQDLTFDAFDPLSAPDRPQSVSANSAISRRLYGLPATRAQYISTMKELLANSWKEDKLLARGDQLVAQVKEVVPADIAANADTAYAPVRDFINGRQAVIEAEIAKPVDWPYPPPTDLCMEIMGTVSGSFSTKWGTIDNMDLFSVGQGMMDFAAPKGSMPATAAMVGSGAGISDGKLGASPAVQILAAFPDGKARLLIIWVDKEMYKAGMDVPFDWQSSFGYFLDVTTSPNIMPLGPLFHGKIHFDQASTKDLDPVTGSFTAEFGN
ncbi:MAG TPA: CotH kinase family protein [Polyangium sp.]|nr:CotH kinase family protein [Polyangium sp.]